MEECEKCPKCSYPRQAGSEECPKCGVIFAKIHNAQLSEAAQEQNSGEASPIKVLPFKQPPENSESHRFSLLGAMIGTLILLSVTLYYSYRGRMSALIPSQKHSEAKASPQKPIHYEGEKKFQPILLALQNEAQKYHVELHNYDLVSYFNDGRKAVHINYGRKDYDRLSENPKTEEAMRKEELGKHENLYRYKTTAEGPWIYSSKAPAKNNNVLECWRRSHEYKTISTSPGFELQARRYGKKYVQVYWIDPLESWKEQKPEVFRSLIQDRMEDLQKIVAFHLAEKKQEAEKYKDQDIRRLKEDYALLQINLKNANDDDGGYTDQVKLDLASLKDYELFEAGALYQFNKYRHFAGLEPVQVADLSAEP